MTLGEVGGEIVVSQGVSQPQIIHLHPQMDTYLREEEGHEGVIKIT